MAKSETPARDALIAKYLNEAYGKERQLETALKAQIGLAKRPAVKKALQDHHKVTKAQAQGLKKRIRELGGKAEEQSLPGPDAVAGTAVSVANKAIAAAKGPVQALRGTSPADNELRNIRDCLWNEAEEIAHYNVIESVAEQLGDKDTVKLAKAYRRQEEQMATVLNREIPKILKEVIKEEVPKEEQPSTSRRRSSTAGSRSSSSSRSASGRSTSGRSTSRSSAAKSTATRSSSSRSTAAKSSGTKSSSTRSTAAKGSGTKSSAAKSSSSNGRAKSSGSSASRSRSTSSSSGSGSKSS